MIRAQGDTRSILKQADGDKPSHRHSNKIIGNTAGRTGFFNHPRRNHWAKRTTQNCANGIRHGHPGKPHRSGKQLGIKRGLLTIGKACGIPTMPCFPPPPNLVSQLSEVLPGAIPASRQPVTTPQAGVASLVAAKPGSAGPKSGMTQGFRSYQWCGRLVLVYIIVRCTRYIRYLQPSGSYV